MNTWVKCPTHYLIFLGARHCHQLRWGWGPPGGPPPGWDDPILATQAHLHPTYWAEAAAIFISENFSNCKWSKAAAFSLNKNLNKSSSRHFYIWISTLLTFEHFEHPASFWRTIVFVFHFLHSTQMCESAMFGLAILLNAHALVIDPLNSGTGYIMIPMVSTKC